VIHYTAGELDFKGGNFAFPSESELIKEI